MTASLSLWIYFTTDSSYLSWICVIWAGSVLYELDLCYRPGLSLDWIQPAVVCLWGSSQHWTPLSSLRAGVRWCVVCDEWDAAVMGSTNHRLSSKLIYASVSERMRAKLLLLFTNLQLRWPFQQWKTKKHPTFHAVWCLYLLWMCQTAFSTHTVTCVRPYLPLSVPRSTETKTHCVPVFPRRDTAYPPVRSHVCDLISCCLLCKSILIFT